MREQDGSTGNNAMEKNKSGYKIETLPSRTLVIHCADPRFQVAFRSFITTGLGIDSYTPLVIGGGVHFLGTGNVQAASAEALLAQIKFFIEEANITQVIVTNHEDCKWYQGMQQEMSGTELSAMGRQDLQVAAATLAREFAGVKVRAIWAGLDGDRVVFDEVTQD